MKNYKALIVANEETKETAVIDVTAKNRKQANEEAAKIGRVICVALDSDECGEYNPTQMGEDAATYFCVATDNGDSEIEHNIFDWAVEFSTYKGVFPNL